MRLILTKQELIDVAISYLKTQNLLKSETEYTGKIDRYSDTNYLDITELQAQTEEKPKEEE